MAQRKRDHRRKQLPRDRDERYRAFVKTTREGIWCIEFDRNLYINMPEDEQFDLFFNHGFIAEANDAYARSVGYEHGEDLIGIRVEDFAQRSDPANIANAKALIHARYSMTGFESIESYKEGRIKRVFLNNSTSIIEEGRVIRIWGTQTDITTQKALEKNLKKAEQMYRTVADFTYDWEYWESLDGKLHYVSPSCQRISGYDAQQFIENPSLFLEIIVPEDTEEWNEHCRDAREELRPRQLQFRIRRQDGEVRWIEHVCQPVYDDEGNPLGIRASNRDITDRKLADIQLRDAYTKIDKLKIQLEAEKAYLQEEIKLEHDFHSIIGNSSGIKYVLFKIEQVAATDSSVLILGETGTGKELVARAIHNNSLQHNRPLIKVNCATLPTNLIENELFGHESGAYTGAQKRRIGHFETADGSSIFLDEIGELPLDLQTKLLGVLQDGEFQRLGSSQSVKVNVRVIAATNRDLEKQVRKRRFRKDLFYRLNVFPITVPPLRDRIDDIPLLVDFFIEKSCKRLGKSIKIIPKSVMNKLEDYSWPGNVRELENVIERAVIISSGSKLRLAEELISSPKDMPTPLKTMEAIEFEHIRRVLKHTNWKVSGKNSAAEILGLKRGTLIARMNKLGIRKP